MVVLTGVLAGVMGSVHLLAGRLKFLDVIPRSRFLSAAGGVAVAYVFLHLLPELSQSQAVVTQATRQIPFFREQHVYMTALAGLVTFYGLERMTKRSDPGSESGDKGEIDTPKAFYLHVAIFGAYNLLIGYLLIHREIPGLRSLLLFWLAMTLHFFTNDYELRMDFSDLYRRTGRWVLTAAVLIGWGIGTVVTVNRLTVAFLFAFLAGGVVLNVLRGELPAERESNFWAFFIGVLAYGVLLLLE